MRSYHQEIHKRKPFYKVDPWMVIEEEFSHELNHLSESIFSLGNGYQGVRGLLEEGYDGLSKSSTPGIYVNGLYFAKKYIYEEEVPKDPKESQTIVNVTDWTRIFPEVDREKLSLTSKSIKNYSRMLHLKKGFLLRRMDWITRSEKILRIEILRLVSLTHPWGSLILYRIVPVNFSGWITCYSLLDGDVSNKHYLQGEKTLHPYEELYSPEGYGFTYTQSIQNPVSLISVAMVNQLLGYKSLTVEKKKGGYSFQTYVEEKKELLIAKYVYLQATRDPYGFESLSSSTMKGAIAFSQKGHEEIRKEQEEFLANYWDRADIEIGGDPSLQQGIRYNLFQLLQSTGRDGKTGIGAKGLTGEFYEGHTFWDMEIYIMPFFLYTWPEVTRHLLNYRYALLDGARDNARRFKNKGALFAWRTINGHEASAYFLGSSLQCHINGAVAYAIERYHRVTGDDGFLLEKGGEILFETARFWVDRSSLSLIHENQYVLNVVSGPDEYKPGVNNNCYTNYMAAFNLEYAWEVAQFLKEKYPLSFAHLSRRLDLEEKEIQEWKHYARNMYRPYDQKQGIHPQDDSFLQKEPLQVDSLTWDDIPLVRNWHPLTIWRYQVIKQADVILLMFLLGHLFALEEKRANFSFYEPLTTHDSSLSPSIYSIIASEIKEHQYASSYFRQTLRLDLDDYNQNTYQGLHMAAMGSSWMVLTFGFAGMRLSTDTLSFDPSLPEGINSYQFKISFKGSFFKVLVNQKVTYQLLAGESLSILHRGENLRLECSPKTVH